MHSHGVEILDAADDHDVVVQVAHHLHLVLFPTEYRFFQQHLGDRTLVQPVAYQVVKLATVVGHGRSRSTQSETRTHDTGQTDLLEHSPRFLNVVHRFPVADVQPNLLHRFFELVALLRLGNHLRIGANHLDAIFFQHAMTCQVHRDV